MMKYKKLLDDEIAAELEAMQEMDTISDDYRVAVDGLTKLIDRSIELEKLENSEDFQIIIQIILNIEMHQKYQHFLD